MAVLMVCSHDVIDDVTVAEPTTGLDSKAAMVRGIEVNLCYLSASDRWCFLTFMLQW